MGKDGTNKKHGDGLFGFLVGKSKKGKEKVAMEKIAKGILKNSKNLRKKGVFVKVGNGGGTPMEDEVFKFMLDLADYMSVELGSTLYGHNGSTQPTDIAGIGIAPYYVNRRLRNTKTQSLSSYDLNDEFGLGSTKRWNYFEIGKAHTHPYGKEYNSRKPSPADVTNKNNWMARNVISPQFFILTKSIQFGKAIDKIPY